MNYRWIVFLSLPLFSTCKSHFPEEKILLTKYEERKQLMTRMDDLHKRVDSIWRHTNETLDASLPDNMPPDERRNMLQVRNADLIQMFEVFDSLDNDLKLLVKDSGMKDRTIADEMRQVMTEIDMLDSIINQNLEILTKKDSLKARAIQSQAES